MRSKIFWSLLFILPNASFSQTLPKALSYFNAGNYAGAQTSLNEVLHWDHQNPAAEFLLAKIFYTRENPKRNLDSANAYILTSAAGLTRTYKEKDLEKLQATGWRAFSVNELQQQINSEAFHVADSINSSVQWNHFISTYTSSPKIKEAIARLNDAAFHEALQKNDYSSFDEFLKKYPDAEQVSTAKELYEKYLYKTQTADSTWQTYNSFMKKYPRSPYFARAKENYERLLFHDVTHDHSLLSYFQFIQQYPGNAWEPVAEDSVYALFTRDGQLNSFTNFISSYPNNRNVERAWQRVYEIETAFFSKKTFVDFKQKYPKYPHMGKIDNDIRSTSRQFEKFEKKGLYGFVDWITRDTVIVPRFTEVAPFNEGMSVVKLPCGKDKCPYAYVAMDGTVISTYPWSDASDFTEGHALAAIGNCDADSCKYGFINRFGQWLVKPRFDDAYEFSEGLALVHDNHLGYGFIDKQGNAVVPLKFTDAGTFSEGVADAQYGDSALYGYIDKTGNTVIIPSFKKAGAFREGLAPAADDRNLWGFIDHTGNWVIKPQYEFALPFINGRAKVVIKEKDKKNPHLIIASDKTIDKRGITVKM